MWLNNFGINIRCLRMRPYINGNKVLLDIKTVISLLEIKDYTNSDTGKMPKGNWIEKERPVVVNIKNMMLALPLTCLRPRISAT